MSKCLFGLFGGKFEIMNRKMALKEAFEMLYRQSNEHELGKTLISCSFNKTKIEQAKKKLCAINIIDSCTVNKENKVECLSWKINVYRRLRSHDTRTKLRKVNHTTQQRQHLRDIMDRLHLSHFLGEGKTELQKSKILAHARKRKNRNMSFLARNIRKVKTSLQIPVDEEQKSFKYHQTPRKFNSRTQAKLEQDTPRTSNRERRNTHKQQNAEKANRVETGFDSGFYELEGMDKTTDNKDVKTLHVPFQTSRKRAHLDNTLKGPLSSKSSYGSESNKKKGRFISSKEKKLGKPGTIATEKEHGVLWKKTLYKPLFSNHCGGTWKQIVEEN